MKTKEAIEQARFTLKNLNSGCVECDKKAKDFYRSVIRDLDMLELLKKYIRVDYTEDGEINIWGFSGIDLEDLSSTEFEKFKKWWG